MRSGRRKTPPAGRWGSLLDVVRAPDLERSLRVIRRGVLDLHVVVVVRGDLMGRALLARRKERLHRALVEHLESDIAPGEAARETTGLHTVNSSERCVGSGLPASPNCTDEPSGVHRWYRPAMRRPDPLLAAGVVLCAALLLVAVYGDRIAPNEPIFLLVN